ncbi:hypothetical protein [Sphingomonas sp.]|uniref:hypothetical protein n=1 Tax=Sphingomonas sp. TaxID=28214 RepID=UPI0031CDEA3D
MITIITAMLMQASIASATGNFQKGRDFIEDHPHAPSSAARPIPPEQLTDVDENAVTAEHFRLANHARREGYSEGPAILHVEPFPGCLTVVSHPMGYEVSGTKRLNGVVSTYKCPGFTLVATYMDLSLPTGGEMSVGHASSETVAVVNGGAVARTFVSLPGSGSRVTDMWTGKQKVLSVSLISKSFALNDMQAKADIILEKMTDSLR